MPPSQEKQTSDGPNTQQLIEKLRDPGLSMGPDSPARHEAAAALEANRSVLVEAAEEFAGWAGEIRREAAEHPGGDGSRATVLKAHADAYDSAAEYLATQVRGEGLSRDEKTNSTTTNSEPGEVG